MFIGWTLCFEMLFYLGMYVYQLSRFVSFEAKIAWIFLSSATAMMLLTEASLRSFFLNPIIVEFGFGVVIGQAYLSRTALTKAESIAAVLAGVVLAALSLIAGYGRIADADLTISGVASAHRVLVWGIPCALIALGGLHIKIANPSSRYMAALIVIGDASYSIYLVHLFALSALRKSSIMAILPPDALILVLTVVGIFAGYLSFRLIEQPIMRCNKLLVDRIFRETRPVDHAVATS
jgi:peptidoglycan/LPS O-acetylase OafA/YrhL